MPTLPILTLRLLDIKLPKDPGVKKMLLNGAKDLAREHQKIFKKKGINIDVFHNDLIQYSGIQLDSFQGTVEWTAIGNEPTKALKLWYKYFKKEIQIPLKNVVKINEYYTPKFIQYRKKYIVSTLVISNDIARELNSVKDKFIRYDRLEKYIYGNLQSFFKHIGFEHIKDENFLKIEIVGAAQMSRKIPVYHGNKKTAYNITFSCNFLLPQSLRLGQSTALGYGRVTHL